MTRDEVDRSIGHLRRLAVLEPDQERSARTRARGRAVLTRQRAAHIRRAARPTARERIEAAPSRLIPIALGAFCVLCVTYVGELVATAVRLLSR